MDLTQAQFEGSPSATLCSACQSPLLTQYWSANGLTVCANCAQQLQAGPPPGGAFFRVLKAFLFGSGAGLVGALGYGLIIHYAKVELALVTILIGWMVGRSVRFGSEHRGGRGYQVMGALLTYVFCMMAYVPDIVVEMTNKPDESVPTVVAVLIAPFVALVVPFTGAMGILGTLILAFGIFQGWKEPAKAVIVVEGPFALGAAAPSEPAPAAAAAP